MDLLLEFYGMDKDDSRRNAGEALFLLEQDESKPVHERALAARALYLLADLEERKPETPAGDLLTSVLRELVDNAIYHPYRPVRLHNEKQISEFLRGLVHV